MSNAESFVPCLLTQPHHPHEWWFTSSGGGHMLDGPDPTEKDVTGPHHCLGAMRGVTLGEPAFEPALESMASIMAGFYEDFLAPIIEVAVGYRAQCIERGFPEAEASAMAADAHRMAVAVVLKGTGMGALSDPGS